MPTAVEKMAGEIKEKRVKLSAFFQKKGADGTLDITAAERDEMKSLNDELDALAPKYERIRGDEKAETDNRKALEDLSRPVVPAGFHGGRDGAAASDHPYAFAGRMAAKRLGDLFHDSQGYKSFRDHVAAGGQRSGELKAFAPDADVKTLFATTAGFDPFVTRLPGVVLSPQQMPKVVDLIPTAQTGEHSIKYMLETTYTNNAAETAEGALYPESAFVFTEQLVPVNKISVFLPITDEQLADAPQIRDVLNNRLEMNLRQRLDLQLLVGNGTAPNLKGLFNISGEQTYAVTSEPNADAFFKAMTLIQTVGFSDPSGIIMNPLDWQNIRLIKTTQGLYIWGNPDSNVTARMWGLPVVTTTYCTQGTGVVADFAAHATLFYRKGVDFLVSNSHADFFQRGQLAVRADMRVAFVIDRATAVCKVTGIV